MSGTGFTIVRETSKRRIKHTQKVQFIIVESMVKALRHAIQDVADMNDRVQLSMNNNQTVPTVKQEFLHWIFLNRQVKELYRDVEDYCGTEKAKPYRQELQELKPPFDLLFEKVEAYCEQEFQIVEVPVEGEEETALELRPREPADNTPREAIIMEKSESTALESKHIDTKHVTGELNQTPTAHPDIKQQSMQDLKREIAAMEEQTSRLEEELKETMSKLNLSGVEKKIDHPRSNSTPLPTTSPVCAPMEIAVPKPEQAEVKMENNRGRAVGKEDLEASMLQTLVKLNDKLDICRSAELLPRLEPEVYDGDPLRFSAWWASFQVSVAANAHSESAKLLYLLRYTKGDAKDSIEWFKNILDSSDVYERACAVLKNTFGNKTVVADAYKDRLNSWPSVREQDAKGLQKFGNYLMQCNSAMDTLRYLSNIDSQEEIRKLAAKLPKSLQNRWNRKADSQVCGNNLSLECYPVLEENEYPSFQQFAAYVLNEARILSRSVSAQPTSSHTNDPPTSNGSRNGGGRTRQHHSFGTQARPRKPTRSVNSPGSDTARPVRTPSCVFCKGEHYLSKCDRFLENTPEFKKTYASSRGLCFGCLSKSHMIGECRWKNPDLLQSTPAKSTNMATSIGFTSEELKHYYTMIVPVWVYIEEKSDEAVLTYALLDSQSSTSFLSDEFCDRMPVSPTLVELELTTLGNTKVISSRRVYDVRVQELSRIRDPLSIKACYTRSSIPGDRAGIPDPRVVSKKRFLKRVAAELAPIMPEVEIHMLIGQDCPEYMKPLEVVQEKGDPMYAILTPLGWTVTGPVSSSVPTRISCMRTKCKEVTQRELKEVFDTGFEEAAEPDRMMSAADLKFLELMEKGFRLINGQVELPLPLKASLEDLNLPDSRPDALRCLFAMKRKILKDPDFGFKFIKFMNDLVSEKAEPVPYPDAILRCKTWYWPCHGVVHPRKPDKVRGVFNGSHEVEGICLNDLLIQGPDLTNNLVGVLCRYRLKRKPLLCDVEGMFLQVLIAPEFRDLTRFVWFEDGDVNKPVRDYRMKVHLFGAKSSPSCANYAFRRTADMFEKKYGKEAADFVRRNFYLDDGLGGADDNARTIDLVNNARSLCAETGFNLHKFGSSEKEVLQAIPTELVAKSLQNLELTTDTLPQEKALGVDVSLESDSFEYKVQLLEKPPSRRGCLSGLSSVYDPLGLVGPAILPGRQLLQNMCTQKLEWDETLSDEQIGKWTAWYHNLMELHKLSIPRCVKRRISDDIVLMHLHTFCDASITGLGAASYLHLQDAEKNDDVNLIYAKSKVAPTKVTTVPRLELQACVLGVRMANFIKSELDLEGLVLYFWTDSMVVLIYIMSDEKRFYMYVMNRADFIRRNSEVGNWRHIGTDRNPADLASRGCPAAELVNSELWWEGPPEIVLRYREVTQVPDVDPNDPELRKPVQVLTLKAEEPQVLSSTLTRISRWEIACGCVSYVLKYGQLKLGNLESDAHNRARGEVLLIKAIQKEAYPEYFKGVISPRGKLQDLSPYLDADGLLRVGGRSQRAQAPFEIRHPLILPQRSRGTQLLVDYYHRKVEHMGVPTTLAAIRRSGLWLVRGRSAVRHYLVTCVICKRRRGKNIRQIMAELPESRVTPAAPFTAAAVDLFGPYKVTVRRSSAKRWICLFVCMISRAVHIEVVHSLSTSSYINALRRFVSRRGPVKSLQCDRGTNFVGADTEIAKADKEIAHEQVEGALALKGCSYVYHTFNSPRASHMGGAWERLIRTVRGALDYVLANPPAQLDDEILLTVSAEAEAVVNSRPISYVDGTDPESPLPLSPMMLLTLKLEVTQELPGKRSSDEVYMKQRWRYVQYLMKLFWDRWRVEILPTMNKRQKWQQPVDDCRVGAVVLMINDQAPRPHWPLGLIEEVIVSHDDRVRRVKVRIQGKVYERPVQKLIALLSPEKEGSSPVKEP